jgi:8-amino-7-oxononanoate synthase
VLEALRRLDIATPNVSGFPIIEVPLADHDEIGRRGQLPVRSGIYTTMAAYPSRAQGRGGLPDPGHSRQYGRGDRHLIEVLGSLRDRFQLLRAASASA